MHQFCIPKAAKTVPAGSDWIHEVKHDGYRGRLERDGAKVRLFSKSGLDWSWRFPLIVEAARKLRTTRFAIDGEIVVLNDAGMSDFAALHSNKNNDVAQFYAFDCLSAAGDDLRDLPLLARKAKLAKLLPAPVTGLFPATYSQGAIGPDLFPVACKMGLEGLVSKHLQRLYRPRTCDWRKIKNRAHPAFSRVI